jgi:hypothetical protein
MHETAFARRCRLLLSAGAVLVGLAVAPPASAQVFSAGFGGTIQNDGASGAGPSSFSKGGYFGFAEMRLEEATLLQVRVGSFRLPGKEVDSPALSVTEASVSVAYMFKEEWFEAGFFGGGGVFWLAPDAPTGDQVPSDLKESVWGLKGGVLTIFRANKNLEFRLEGGVTYLAGTYAQHTPIVLGAAISYRF